MTFSAEASGGLDEWRAVRGLHVLCVGNGGMVIGNGQALTHRYIRDFLTELGARVGEVCFCNWLEQVDDPLARTPLSGIAGVRPLGLAPFHGPPWRKLLNGTAAFARIAREVLWADFVYVYWPGRLSAVVAWLCSVLRRPYGIYLRGKELSRAPSVEVFEGAKFVLTTGHVLLDIAQAHCRDVETVTPMTSLRAEHLVPPRSPRRTGPWELLYVGRIEERKGIKDLLGAMALLKDWELPVSLTMVGHCSDARSLLRQLPSSLAGRVRIVGAVSEFEKLIPFYCGADAFVFPSHDEGFPRVLYEAMAFGLPIVTTFVGGIPSVMQDRINCLRIAEKNPADAADKIRLLLANPDVQSSIAQGGHSCIIALLKAWQRPHWAQILERLRRLVGNAAQNE